MDIYLRDPEGPTLRIPVMPPEIAIKREKSIETVEIINIGEVDFPKGEKIKEISFSSFFPKEYDSSYCRHPDLMDPQDAMNQLTAWMAKKGPVRLMIPPTIINVLVLVSVNNSVFRGGEPDDVYYELVCRTWREIKVRTSAEKAAQVDTGGTALLERPDLKPKPAIYEVVPGDTLWNIAKLQYGKGSRWKEIYDNNREEIGPSYDLITPGMKLVMPV